MSQDYIPTEEQVRALRDKVYGVPIKDEGWRNCRDKWVEPEQVKWLKEKVGK